MEVTFWGVRGSIPAPGPSTVRYGGNTSCLSVRTSSDHLIVIDCGTGARNLGTSLMNGASAFARGEASATILLSHAHWDHIQGFPFFLPLYVAGNRFTLYGGGESSALLEGILEGQMAPQYFPVQTLKNMGAEIEIKAVEDGAQFELHGCRVQVAAIPHGKSSVLAFRLEEGGRSMVYIGDAGYGEEGPSESVRRLCRTADLLIHDSTYTPEDRARYRQRGLASVAEAVDCAAIAEARKLVLFHYDQDYTDADVDALAERARKLLDERGAGRIVVEPAAEGSTLTV